jgi:hypothetical protein
MAGDTYYYLFSFTLMVAVIVRLIGIILFRRKGITLFGDTLQRNSLRYKNLKRTSKRSYLIVTAFLTVVLVGNVVFEIGRLLQYHSSNAYFVLIFMPIMCGVGFIVVFAQMRRRLHETPSNK